MVKQRIILIEITAMIDSHDCDNCNIYVNLWQRFLILSKIYITVTRKERFPAGKTKLVWGASLKMSHILLNCSSVY